MFYNLIILLRLIFSFCISVWILLILDFYSKVEGEGESLKLDGNKVYINSYYWTFLCFVIVQDNVVKIDDDNKSLDIEEQLVDAGDDLSAVEKTAEKINKVAGDVEDDSASTAIPGNDLCVHFIIVLAIFGASVS